MSLRVAHISATFPPYRGGTGNVCMQNARELARRGHQVTVLTAAVAGAPAREERDGVVVRRLRPLLRVGNAPLLPGLLPALRGFDIAHLHYPFFGGELAALAAALRRTPLVVTYHQDVLLGGWMGAAATILRHTLGRAALRSAARVLFTSADYAQASHMRPLLRGREARIGALPNGVDAERFRPGQPAALRRRLGLAEGAGIALLVAGLDRPHAFKGVEVFLEALALTDLHAVIIGEGELRPAYQRSAAARGLAGRARFVGPVADADLPAYYGAADLTVLPSTTMGEAFGLVLLESLACGTPVVASDLPGVRSVVERGVDGLLVPPGDAPALAAAMADLLSAGPRRRAMGLRGRARALAHYAWPAVGERLERLYAEVLGGQLSTRTLLGGRP